MIKKLFAIIEKDVRQLVHSKSSALIILISPIVLMILAGLALSSFRIVRGKNRGLC